MKKLLAVLLALICTFSVVLPASAGLDDAADSIMGDLGLGDIFGEEESDILTNGVHYEMGTLPTVTIFYTPSPSITFNAPTDMIITEDYPIALDHDWIAWMDPETGKYYYPGDVIHVEGEVTLVAVWVEKTDNYPAFIRSAIAGLKSFIKLIEKFLGIYKAVEDAKPVPTEAPSVNPEV